jgi:hypothetical protein
VAASLHTKKGEDVTKNNNGAALKSVPAQLDELPERLSRATAKKRTAKKPAVKKPKGPTAAALRKERQAARDRRNARTRDVVAVVMPAFALAATVQAGHLAQHGASWWAVGSVAAIALGVYWTSVPHVAMGLRRVCHLDTVAAWLMAVAIDGAVVGGEIARMTGGIEWLAWLMMLGGVVLSAAFNRVGFETED